jgi:hypothetical protein
MQVGSASSMHMMQYWHLSRVFYAKLAAGFQRDTGLHDCSSRLNTKQKLTPLQNEQSSQNQTKQNKKRKTKMTQEIITSANVNELSMVEPGIDVEVTDTAIIIINPRPAEIEDNGNPHTKRQFLGATILSALVGCLCGGPWVGVAAASGAALAVSSRSKTGEVARASGEAPVAKVGDRITQFDHNHHIVEKTADGAIQGFHWTTKRIKPKESHRHSPAA